MTIPLQEHLSSPYSFAQSGFTNEGDFYNALFHDEPQDPSATFLSVLTAPYTPPAPPASARLGATFPDPDAARKSFDMVDWSSPNWSPPTPNTNDEDSSDEEANAPPPPKLKGLTEIEIEEVTIVPTLNDRRRVIYAPHEKWAWTNGLAIEDPEILMYLGKGVMCSATVKRGKIGGRQLTYVSKCWSKSKQHDWDGFHSELALYKCAQYLQPLQGLVVPPIIGVYTLPAEISVAMEPPHRSFWIEASSDMPDILKELCIDAYAKIHARGVLHGDPELRHMLIGGDGRVTIIDFQYSKALVYNDPMQLEKCSVEELRKEMRQVKFKLDYAGAREIEKQKVIKKFGKCLIEGREPSEQELKDTEDDGPISPKDFVEAWVKAMNATPRRFVMPGQKPDDVARSVAKFLGLVKTLEGAKTLQPPSSTRPEATPWLLTSLIRKAFALAPPQHDIIPRDPSPIPTNGIAPLSASTSATTSQSTLVSRGNSSSPSTPSITSSTPKQMIQETDFAFEIPKDAELYQPLLRLFNSVDGHNKSYQIRYYNGRKCLDLGLPHPDVLHFLGKRPEDDPIQRKQIQRRTRLLRAEGSLKRAREDEDEPGAAIERAARKKTRYFEKEKADSLSRKRKRGEEDMGGEEEGYSSPDDLPNIPEGPKILSQMEYLDHQASVNSSSSRPSEGIRSILRKDVPVKGIHDCETPYTDYLIRRSGNKLALMGVRYGNPSFGKKQTAAPSGSSRTSRRPPSKRNRAGIDLDISQIMDQILRQPGTSGSNHRVERGEGPESSGFHCKAKRRRISFSTSSPPTSLRSLNNWIASILRWF